VPKIVWFSILNSLSVLGFSVPVLDPGSLLAEVTK